MAHYAASMKQLVGCPCEVLKLDNQILFAGTVQGYDIENEDLAIAIRKGTETPRGIVYHTPVKLHVHTDRSLQKVMLLYGVVTRCAADFWKITLKYTFACVERRSNFRQTVFAEAVVTRNFDEEVEQQSSSPCRIMDVSLSGLCFRNRETYLPGETIEVSSIQLRQDGSIYTFICTVERSWPLENGRAGEMCYGCKYKDIPEHEEDQLFHDLFSLQIKALNRLR